MKTTRIMLKRLLGVLLAAAICCTALPAMVFAAATETEIPEEYTEIARAGWEIGQATGFKAGSDFTDGTLTYSTAYNGKVVTQSTYAQYEGLTGDYVGYLGAYGFLGVKFQPGTFQPNTTYYVSGIAAFQQGSTPTEVTFSMEWQQGTWGVNLDPGTSTGPETVASILKESYPVGSNRIVTSFVTPDVSQEELDAMWICFRLPENNYRILLDDFVFYGADDVVRTYAQLQELIAQAGDFSEREDYSEEDWSAFTEALATAKGLTESSPAGEIDAAYTALEAAIRTLQEYPVPSDSIIPDNYHPVADFGWEVGTTTDFREGCDYTDGEVIYSTGYNGKIAAASDYAAYEVAGDYVGYLGAWGMLGVKLPAGTLEPNTTYYMSGYVNFQKAYNFDSVPLEIVWQKGVFGTNLDTSTNDEVENVATIFTGSYPEGANYVEISFVTPDVSQEELDGMWLRFRLGQYNYRILLDSFTIYGASSFTYEDLQSLMYMGEAMEYRPDYKADDWEALTLALSAARELTAESDAADIKAAFLTLQAALLTLQAYPPATGLYRYEAEDMQLNHVRFPTTGGVDAGEAIGVYWQFDDGFRPELTDDSFGRLILNAPEAGEYTIEVGYYAAEYPMRVYVNGELQVDVTLPSNSWSGGTQQMTVTLEEGDNVLLFCVSRWGCFDYVNLPYALQVVETETTVPDTYHAADALLQSTRLLPVESLFDPAAQLYTDVLQYDSSDGYIGKATFTVDATLGDSVTLHYYVTQYADDGSATLAVSVNGGAAFQIDLSGTKTGTELTYTIDANTLAANGLVDGENTIAFSKPDTDDQEGLYSLTVQEDPDYVEVQYMTQTGVELQDEIVYRGRTMVADETSVAIDWSGSGFEFNFHGEGAIFANITTEGGARFAVYVDGEKSMKYLVDGSNRVLLASGLERGDHTISVLKTTEARGSLAQLDSLTFNEGSVLTKTAKKDYNFFVLGGSASCGNQIFTDGTEDASYSYIVNLANAYNADWHTVAVSGRGLIQGYNSEDGWAGSTEKQLRDLYEYTSFFRDETVKWDHTSYVPDVIIVNAGGNDLGEAIMETTGLGVEDYMKAMQEFSLYLREQYPDALIMWFYGVYINRAYEAEYRAAVEELNDENIRLVYTPQMNSGAANHPDVKEHMYLAQIFSEQMAPFLGVENPLDLYIEPEVPADNEGGYLEELDTPLPGVAEGSTRYEGEDGVITGSSKVGGIETGEFFSGGKAAGGFDQATVTTLEEVDFAAGNIPNVKFTVHSDYAGETTMTIGFNGSDPGVAYIVEVNGVKQLVVQPDVTGAKWNQMGWVKCTVTLQAGENVIYVSCPVSKTQQTTGSWRNIDFIELVDITAETALGDVNGDGKINSSDARMVLQATVEFVELTPEQETRADVNTDGTIDSRDARWILQRTVE